MGQTLTQKILSQKAGKPVKTGEIVEIGVDFTLTHDVTGPIAVSEFDRMGAGLVWDRDRVALVLDHATPSKDIQAAEACRKLRRFAAEQGISRVYDEGQGVEHVLLPESRWLRPGSVLFGADSHTVTAGACALFATGVGSTDLAAIWALGTTWIRVPAQMRLNFTGEMPRWLSGKDLILYVLRLIGTNGAHYASMEFTGPVISRLDMDQRFTLCNMSVEAGAKNGIVPADEVTAAFFGVSPEELKELVSDEDATYEQWLEVDVTGMPPQVAVPSSPGNVKDVTELGDIQVDRVFIGSCTNGRLGDLKAAAEVLRGKRIARGVVALVLPGSTEVFREALKRGLVDTFLEAGVTVGPPSCGPCYGGHLGVAGPGEVVVSTSNRNFRGRMGHADALVYLASPAVAAASAVTGRISSPEEVI